MVRHPQFTLTDRDALQILRAPQSCANKVLNAAFSRHADPRFQFTQRTLQAFVASDSYFHQVEVGFLHPRYVPEKHVALWPGHEALWSRMDLEATAEELSKQLCGSSSSPMRLAIGGRADFLPTEDEYSRGTHGISPEIAEIFFSRRAEWVSKRESMTIKTQFATGFIDEETLSPVAL